MSEKILNSRMVQKHDIEANWLKATNFTPLQGELIVYDVDENYNYERIKMGDGVTNVNELPFISPQADWNQNDENATDYVKNRTHYSEEQIVKDQQLAPKRGAIGESVVYRPASAAYDLPVGTLCVVYFDDTPYLCESQEMPPDETGYPAYSLGDEALEEYPFFVRFTVGGTRVQFSVINDGATHTIDVYTAKKQEYVLQLDEKYIPYTIARRAIAETNVSGVGLYKSNQNIISVSSFASEIPEEMFYDCSNLIGASLFRATSIGERAFMYCGNLLSLRGTWARNIQAEGFKFCSSLVHTELPNVEEIGEEAFDGTSIETIDLPKLRKLGAGAFSGCTALKAVNFPSLVDLSSEDTAVTFAVFSNCSALEKALFPKLSALYSTEFSGCMSLKLIDLGLITNIPATGLGKSLYSLKALALRSETLCEITTDILVNSGHFTGTVIATTYDGIYNPKGLKDGYIYVPSSLIASYEEHPIWGKYIGQFRPLEDYTVDGTITGALDEGKILSNIIEMPLATDADVWETLINIGLYERLADENGNVLTDEANAILLI